MKTRKIISYQLIVMWYLIGFVPSGFAQDALKQLDGNNNQGIIQQSQTPAEKAINDDKIKATMSPDEFKGYEGAKAYVDQNSNYTLGADDVIDIVVMRHPEVSGEYTINKEGKIQYEFVGDVILAGLTKEQAIDLLSKKLSVYIIKPEITLKLRVITAKLFMLLAK